MPTASCQLAAAKKRIAALEAIVAKLPKTADGAQGYGLNKDQQKAIADLWAWQEQSLRSDIVLGGPIAKAALDQKPKPEPPGYVAGPAPCVFPGW